MKFTFLNGRHLKALKAMVAADRFSTGESVLDLHAKDESRHPACRPQAVIWPVDKTEVSNIIKYASQNRIAVTCWGSGSSLEGNPIPCKGGLVLDFTRMDRIIELREADFQVDVEPGLVYQDLNQRLRSKGLFFPPDPGARATIGGMIANNASGTKTVRYGSTKHHVMRLTVALADGEIIELGTRASKSSSGYELLPVFVGSEGTLGVVVQATLRLTPLPQEYSGVIANFVDLLQASRAVFDIVRYGLDPASIELLGPECVALINQEKQLGLAESPTLIMEFHGATRSYLAEILEMTQEICKDNGCKDFRSGLEGAERTRLLEARHHLGEMIIRNHPGYDGLVIDVAVPISVYPEMIQAAGQERARTGLQGYTFSHAGDGNIHFHLLGRRGDERQWDLIHAVADRMVQKALDLGGTATGEHGVGIGKRKFMVREHGAGLAWMRRIKTLFDPEGILNPGKIF
jgi:D-lactate dehydrogenase (cytochrome)